MKLYRLDATHELDGSLSQFYRDHQDTLTAIVPLSQGGWFVDVYEIDLPRPEPQTIEMLCGTTWPNAPEAELVAYIEARQQRGQTAMQTAQENLSRILNTQLARNTKKRATTARA